MSHCQTCGAETSLGDTCHDCNCFDCERCGKMIDFDDDITVNDATGCELKVCEACLRNDDRMVEGSFSEAQRIPTDEDEAIAMLTDMPGGATAQRVDKLAAVLADHPDATLATCGDERTGVRFGEAKCRRGRAIKIGRSTFHYQLWATWND